MHMYMYIVRTHVCYGYSVPVIVLLFVVIVVCFFVVV